MPENYVGEIRYFSFGIAPKGWVPCDGRELEIWTNQALFSLLGNTYGGDGKRTFAVPNLQGRVPIHCGAGFPRGRVGGEEAHALVVAEMPVHTHGVSATSTKANAAVPAPRSGKGFLWAAPDTEAEPDVKPFSGQSNTSMSPDAVSLEGEGEPHPNMQPYLVVNACIALDGVYPPKT